MKFRAGSGRVPTTMWLTRELAARTDMCAPLSDNDALDGCAASGTRLPGPAEHLQSLMIAAPPASHRVEVRVSFPERCAHIAEAAMQHGPDGMVQTPCFLRGKLGRPATWMKPCQPQGFVHIDIAQAGDRRLVEQQRLQSSLTRLEYHVQCFGRKGGIEGLQPQSTQDRIGGLHEVPTPKFACVMVTQLTSVVEKYDNSIVRVGGCCCCDEVQSAGHAQVYDQRSPGGQRADDTFATSRDTLETLPLQLAHKRGGAGYGDSSLPVHHHLFNVPANQATVDQVGDDCLNFG